MSKNKKSRGTRITHSDVAEIRRNNKFRPKMRLRKVRGRKAFLMPQLRHSPDILSITEHFIAPMMAEIGADNYTKYEKIVELFSAHYREVVMATAKNNFTMLGAVWHNGPNDLRAPTTREARILKGTPLMVRLDERMPDRIDIERCDLCIIFSLTLNEYLDIYLQLRELTGCDIRLTPPRRHSSEDDYSD